MNRPWPSGSTSSAGSPRRAAIRYEVRALRDRSPSTSGSPRPGDRRGSPRPGRRRRSPGGSRASSRIRLSATTSRGGGPGGRAWRRRAGATSRARGDHRGRPPGTDRSAGAGRSGCASKTPVWPARKTTTVSWGWPLTCRGDLVEGRPRRLLASPRRRSGRSASPGLPVGVEPAVVEDLADPLGVALGELELAPARSLPTPSARMWSRPGSVGPVVARPRPSEPAVDGPFAAGHARRTGSVP